jgi:hypothetical protein
VTTLHLLLLLASLLDTISIGAGCAEQITTLLHLTPTLKASSSGASSGSRCSVVTHVIIV